jgi:hypothetical protein
MTQVTKLTTVYGDVVYVSTADWDGFGRQSIMLHRYTRDGRRWDETKEGQMAVQRGNATSIHRDNLCPPNIAAMAAVIKAAERILAKIDNLTTQEFANGDEITEREALRDALAMLQT